MKVTEAKGLRKTNKLRDTQTSVKGLSATVALGGRYRLFFRFLEKEDPTDANDIITAVQPVRKLDRDVFGQSVVKIDNYIQTDGGRIIDASGLDVYANCAKVLHNAAAVNAKRKLEREAKEAAEELKTSIDAAALQESLRKCDVDYFGDRKANPPTYPKKNPIIGPLTLEVATECLVVPLDSSGAPKVTDARLASVALSGTKSSQLITLLDDANYTRPEEGFLEVGYNYVGANKQEAGRAANFQGISKEMSLMTMFPAMEKELKAQLDTLAKSDDVIKGRNYNMNSPITPTDIITGTHAWARTQRPCFASIDFEADVTKYSAKDLLKSGLVEEYVDVKSKLEALVASEKDNTDVKEDVEETANAQEVLQAAVTTEGMDALRDVTGAVDLSKVTDGSADLDEL